MKFLRTIMLVLSLCCSTAASAQTIDDAIKFIIAGNTPSEMEVTAKVKDCIAELVTLGGLVKLKLNFNNMMWDSAKYVKIPLDANMRRAAFEGAELALIIKCHGICNEFTAGVTPQMFAVWTPVVYSSRNKFEESLYIIRRECPGYQSHK